MHCTSFLIYKGNPPKKNHNSRLSSPLYYCNNGSVRLWQEGEAYPIKEGKVYVPLSLRSTVVCVHCRLYTAGGKEKGEGVGV